MKRVLISTLFLIVPAICSAQPGDSAPPGSSPPPAATPPVPDSSNIVGLPSTAGMSAHSCRPDRWFPAAMHAGQYGTVILAFRIDAAGKPQNIAIKISSGHSGIDSGAIDCASRWQYVPGVLNSSPAETLWSADVQLTSGMPHQTAPYINPSLRFCPGYPASNIPNPKATVLLIKTGADGAVADTSVVQSSGDPSLDQFALACTSTASFKQDLTTIQPTAGSLLFPLFWPWQSK